MKLKSRTQKRQKRHERVRRKVQGTSERPRMSIMVSGKNIYVQFIDDEKGATLASASTISDEKKKNLEAAASLGKRAADAAGKAGIKSVVVDRGGHKFHGRLRAIVDEVVKAGLLPAGKDAAAEDKEDK